MARERRPSFDQSALPLERNGSSDRNSLYTKRKERIPIRCGRKLLLPNEGRHECGVSQ
jgi:hypothetical protein